jgi:hypothetical protein
MFVEDPKDIKGVFDRSTHAISGALEKFVSRMKE